MSLYSEQIAFHLFISDFVRICNLFVDMTSVWDPFSPTIPTSSKQVVNDKSLCTAMFNAGKTSSNGNILSVDLGHHLS